MTEVWLEIEEAPRYLVSSQGRVQNRMTGRILKARPDRYGYPHVDLTTNDGVITRTVHTLEAKAFYDGDHESLEVNHEDGIKDNNFIANLEWMTSSENSLHAYRLGLRHPQGGRKGLPVRIVETGEEFESETACALAIDGHKQAINACLRGRHKTHKGYTFEYVEEP
jgi:hypothetical protein